MNAARHKVLVIDVLDSKSCRNRRKENQGYSNLELVTWRHLQGIRKDVTNFKGKVVEYFHCMRQFMVTNLTVRLKDDQTRFMAA